MKYTNNLRQYRLKAGLTQEEVFKKLGQSSSSRISAWENGSALPSTKFLIQLSSLYKVPIDKLIGGLPEKKRKKKKPAPQSPSHYDLFFTDNVPPRTGESTFAQMFGKEHDDMTEKELLDIYAEIIAEHIMQQHKAGLLKPLTKEQEREAERFWNQKLKRRKE